MNTQQQKLLERLENALRDISKNPKTTVEVAPLLEDLVFSFEEIANDLKTTSDKEIAAALRVIVHAAMPMDDTSLLTEQLAANV